MTPLTEPAPLSDLESVLGAGRCMSASSALSIGVLGPLEVRTLTKPVHVGGKRLRALLIRLSASANTPIPPSRIAEDLWDAEPPAGAASTLQSHVSSLRKILGPDRVLFRDGGYLLAADRDEIDAVRFLDHSRRGRRLLAANDVEAARRCLHSALCDWRGPALADVAHMMWAESEIAHLDAVRVNATEALVEAHLISGDHLEAAVLSRAALTSEPLRESFWAQHMLALYRCGDQGGALRAYRRLRQVLRDELGIAPTRRVSALETAILTQAPELDWTPGRPMQLQGESVVFGV